jgi:hypothetical protein
MLMFVSFDACGACRGRARKKDRGRWRLASSPLDASERLAYSGE